jgi:hypothetical protein
MGMQRTVKPTKLFYADNVPSHEAQHLKASKNIYDAIRAIAE